MSKDFKRLCELTAPQIDLENITNAQLDKIMKRVIQKNGDFVFFSRKGHNDYTAHEDATEMLEEGTSHSDSNAHEDHTDHYDHTESSHSDEGYSESSSHTESNGHRDYTESSHTDR